MWIPGGVWIPGEVWIPGGVGIPGRVWIPGGVWIPFVLETLLGVFFPFPQFHVDKWVPLVYCELYSNFEVTIKKCIRNCAV